MSATVIPHPALYIEHGSSRRMVQIGQELDGRAVQVRETFGARYELDGVGTVKLNLIAKEGQVLIEQLTVTPPEGDGVLGVTLAGIPIQRLVESAVWRAAWIYGSSLETAVHASTVASRRRVSDERLAGVLVAFDEGGIRAVKDLENVGDRQAYRLVARARQQAGT